MAAGSRDAGRVAAAALAWGYSVREFLLHRICWKGSHNETDCILAGGLWPRLPHPAGGTGLGQWLQQRPRHAPCGDQARPTMRLHRRRHLRQPAVLPVGRTGKCAHRRAFQALWRLQQGHPPDHDPPGGEPAGGPLPAADGTGIEAAGSASSKSYSAEGEQLVINRWSSCKPGEAGAGCIWSRVELSCTVENDPVVKQVDGGAVLLALIIPMGQRRTQFGVYRRVDPAE